MEIIRVSRSRPSQTKLEPALASLLAGGVIVHPTETVYGLGVDAWNVKAVARVRDIKGRKPAKPMLALVKDHAMAEQYAYFDERALKLSREFWPGPLTMVLPAKDLKVAQNLGDARKIALRVSPEPMVRTFIEAIKGPLLSTSANVNGQDVCYNTEDVERQFANRQYQPDFIINAGKLPAIHPSTVIDLTRPGLVLIRAGQISRADIESVLR